MASEARYRLLVNDNETKPLFRASFVKSATYVSGMIFSAFIFCIIYSIIYNFESSTSTQCQAYNILPSVSAAIGGYSPQKEIWKFAIVLAAPFRFLVIYFYGGYNLEVCKRKASTLILVTGFLNIIENISLISLSVFDSSNYYAMHEKSFITFILTSELYMLMLVYMHNNLREHARNLGEARGLRWKKRMVVINITGILFATYFFVQHNWTCPDFAYTKFAFCEYIVVTSNIVFHLTSVYDFNDKDLVITTQGMYLTQR